MKREKSGIDDYFPPHCIFRWCSISALEPDDPVCCKPKPKAVGGVILADKLTSLARLLTRWGEVVETWA